MIEITIEVRGPVPEGRATDILDEYLDDATGELASVALARTQEVLNERIQRPTPYYETQVTREKVGHAHYVNHDRAIVYGPWLEGVGSRNYPATSFKGYKAFTAGYLEIAFTADDHLDRVLIDYLARLDGA